MAPRKRSIDPAGFVDELQSSGRYTFVRNEVPSAGGRSSLSIEAALRRLKKVGRIVSPRRGFFVIVPLEHSSAGSPPASWFIHDLMGFVGQPYYVGLLTAAGIHGAAHQQPMVFQVITDRPTREIEAGRNRVEFHMSNRIEDTPVTEVQTETGSMRASIPESTAYDLIRFPAAAGHLSNVATVLGELVESMSAEALVEQAEFARLPEVQRLGYLLDLVGAEDLAEQLAGWLSSRRRRAVLLRPDGVHGTQKLNRRWHVIPNEKVEVDL